jgi:hypothetical protein
MHNLLLILTVVLASFDVEGVRSELSLLNGLVQALDALAQATEIDRGSPEATLASIDKVNRLLGAINPEWAKLIAFEVKPSFVKALTLLHSELINLMATKLAGERVEVSHTSESLKALKEVFQRADTDKDFNEKINLLQNLREHHSHGISNELIQKVENIFIEEAHKQATSSSNSGVASRIQAFLESQITDSKNTHLLPPASIKILVNAIQEEIRTSLTSTDSTDPTDSANQLKQWRAKLNIYLEKLN